MESYGKSVEQVNEDPVIPLLIQSLLLRRLPHDLPSRMLVIKISSSQSQCQPVKRLIGRDPSIPGNSRSFGQHRTVRHLQSRRLPPWIPLEMFPSSLLTDWSHREDDLFALISDTFLLHHQTESVRVWEDTAGYLVSLEQVVIYRG